MVAHHPANNKKITIALLSGIAILSLFIKLPKIFYINTSPSIPLGIYKVIDPALNPSKIILFHPPESLKNFNRPWLPPRLIIMKPIVAAKGDLCCVADNTIKINGKYYGKVQKFDSGNFPLPSLNFCRPLKSDEVWVGSNRIENSFDSRYFGPIPEDKIIATVAPFIIFGRKT